MAGDALFDDSNPELQVHQFLTFRLMRLQSRLNAQAIDILRETSGLTLSKWRALALVGARDQTRLTQIAMEGALDKGLLSRNLKILIAEGLVKSEQDEGDNRAQLLSLTAQGRAVYDRTLPVMRRRQAHLRAALTEEEFEILGVAMEKLEGATDYRG